MHVVGAFVSNAHPSSSQAPRLDNFSSVHVLYLHLLVVLPYAASQTQLLPLSSTLQESCFVYVSHAANGMQPVPSDVHFVFAEKA